MYLAYNFKIFFTFTNVVNFVWPKTHTKGVCFNRETNTRCCVYFNKEINTLSCALIGRKTQYCRL